MSYNHQELPKYMRTAGKITVVTAITGLLVFVLAFIFDAGTKELSKVSAAGNATTTLTVLNTPPEFTLSPYEVVESSTSSPTNSGDVVSWSAIGTDSNGAPYFLLICDDNATPTANATVGALGTAAPSCNATTSATQWGVSVGTLSGTLAVVSTTTAETASSPFDEVNAWFAWVCDDDPVNPRCNSVPQQGLYATSSSPFHVNNRPVLTNFYNNGPADPGALMTFFSTSSDPDTNVNNTMRLVVCGSNSYSTVTNDCTANFLSSTLISLTDNAYATITIPAIMRDQAYSAYGFLVDQYGHEATANPISNPFTVNNVAPVVTGGDIVLNGGIDMTLTQPGTETTGFTLNFKIKDANSCLNSASTSEITGYDVVVLRGGVGTSTCDGTVGSYNPNNCYPNDLATTTWNLACAPTAACPSPLVDEIDYTCTFPLWFLADPTDSLPGQIPAWLDADIWSVGVAGKDDDALTGFMATTSSPVELISFKSIDILSAEITYGGIEPGDDTGTLKATSTLLNLGNVGLDQETQGESMCGTFAIGNECAVSATSTIQESYQKFATTSLTYISPFAQALSSSTPFQLELNVKKTVATSTPKQGITYWGIAVPASITLAGSYTGMNTFTAVTAEDTDWY